MISAEATPRPAAHTEPMSYVRSGRAAPGVSVRRGRGRTGTSRWGRSHTSFPAGGSGADARCSGARFASLFRPLPPGRSPETPRTSRTAGGAPAAADPCAAGTDRGRTETAGPGACGPAVTDTQPVALARTTTIRDIDRRFMPWSTTTRTPGHVGTTHPGRAAPSRETGLGDSRRPHDGAKRMASARPPSTGCRWARAGGCHARRAYAGPCRGPQVLTGSGRRNR